MAETRLADLLSFINHQMRTQEKIETYLWKLEALLTIATSADNFYDHPGAILHNYLSIAGDLIEKAAKANQMSLSELFKLGKTVPEWPQ